MSIDDEPLHVEPDGPARALAAVIPLVAVALVLLGAMRGSMQRSADSPISPWAVAVLTLAGAALLSWRSLTQRATLGADGLVSRNLTSTVRLPWASVEELRAVPRPGVVVVEIHVRGLRRQLRLGAASRWPGADADRVLAQIAAHPRAGALLTRMDP